MAGVHQRNAEQVGQAHADVAGIGIVAVHQVRRALLLVQPQHQVVDEAVEVIPQLLLGDVLVGSGVDAHDAGLVAEGFDGQGVVVADRGVDDAAGDQVDAFDVVLRGRARARSTTYLVCPPVSASRPSSRSWPRIRPWTLTTSRYFLESSVCTVPRDDTASAATSTGWMRAREFRGVAERPRDCGKTSGYPAPAHAAHQSLGS